MDKRKSSSYSRVITVLLLLSCFTTFGQCNDSISIVQVDSCKIVQMSPKKFTEFYKYKKNLEKIKKELPGVESALDSLRKSNSLIQENLEAEIDSTNKQKSLVIESLDDCTETLAEIDIENAYLTNRVAELQRRQWNMFGYGGTIGVVSVFLIKLLLQ